MAITYDTRCKNTGSACLYAGVIPSRPKTVVQDWEGEKDIGGTAVVDSAPFLASIRLPHTNLWQVARVA